MTSIVEEGKPYFFSLDFSPFQVLFRMNFLTFVLCLTMNRPYQAYYFVPLISFWFSFQYLVMAIPPKVGV